MVGGLACTYPDFSNLFSKIYVNNKNRFIRNATAYSFGAGPVESRMISGARSRMEPMGRLFKRHPVAK